MVSVQSFDVKSLSCSQAPGPRYPQCHAWLDHRTLTPGPFLPDSPCGKFQQAAFQHHTGLQVAQQPCSGARGSTPQAVLWGKQRPWMEHLWGQGFAQEHRPKPSGLSQGQRWPCFPEQSSWSLQDPGHHPSGPGMSPVDTKARAAPRGCSRCFRDETLLQPKQSRKQEWQPGGKTTCGQETPEHCARPTAQTPGSCAEWAKVQVPLGAE